MMFSDGSSSGHMGAPYNCPQSLYKVLAESTLQGRNSARVIETTVGGSHGGGEGEGEEGGWSAGKMTSRSLENVRSGSPPSRTPSTHETYTCDPLEQKPLQGDSLWVATRRSMARTRPQLR